MDKPASNASQCETCTIQRRPRNVRTNVDTEESVGLSTLWTKNVGMTWWINRCDKADSCAAGVIHPDRRAAYTLESRTVLSSAKTLQGCATLATIAFGVQACMIVAPCGSIVCLHAWRGLVYWLLSWTKGFRCRLWKGRRAEMPDSVVRQLCRMSLIRALHHATHGPTETKPQKWIKWRVCTLISHWWRTARATRTVVPGELILPDGNDMNHKWYNLWAGATITHPKRSATTAGR